MIVLDNEKDIFIKKMLKEDELISKKAEDIFNNFLEGEMKIKDEKVVNIEESKDKKSNRKKILSMVATLVIVFLGANVYAVTKGYNNIFFMIKDLSTKTISEKDEILKDQDTTISYEPIEIAKGIKVQFNKFVVKDNKAKLIMSVEQDEGTVSNKIRQVEVINGDDNSQLVTVPFENEETKSYTKEIEIGFFNNNINLLKVNINSQKENLATIQIDLNNREITILNNSYKEVEKISEIELKEILSKYAILNLSEEMLDKEFTKEQCINYNLVYLAIEYIYDKEEDAKNIDFTAEKVNKAIKEIAGIEVQNHLDMKEGLWFYNEKNKRYEYDNGDESISALCLNITDISYENGVYSVDYQCCYPSENDYLENTIYRLPVYKASLLFKINEDYEYAKYSIVSNIYDLKVKKETSGNKEETLSPSNNIENTDTTITENKLVSKEYENLEDIAIEYRYSSKIKNYKDFNYDLDNDGKIDKITIRKDKNSEYDNYLFELNGNVFDKNSFLPEIYIVDLDKEDDTLEVVIFDYGPSDDLEYSIYVKQGDKMEKISTFAGSRFVLDSKGNFKVKTILTAGITPDVYDLVYNFSNNEITSKDNDFDQEEEYLAENYYITRDLDNLAERYYESIDNLETVDIKELGNKDYFKIKSFIDDTKAIVEYKGDEYYLFSHQRNLSD